MKEFTGKTIYSTQFIFCLKYNMLYVVICPWRRAWQLALVFFPGDSRGQRSLVGYRLWGCKESDTT